MKKVTICLGLITTVLVVAASVQANSSRVTRGDAQALFEAFGGGGWAVLLHDGSVEGAPADFQPDSNARISPASQWNGRHFCSLDWHLISLAAIEGNAEGQSRTSTEIHDVLTQIDLDFTLDGAPLETTQSSIKRFLNPALRGLVEAWYVQEGRVMAPEDLSVGRHTLQATGRRPGRPPNVMPPITFFVDAPGSGTCVV